MARWLVKNFKMLINTEKSDIVDCMKCRKYVGLTLTWDVLKLHIRRENLCLVLINFNMGCIETQPVKFKICRTAGINFNMGCIETTVSDIIYP